jgi:probable HAF family extracellular repeat protein
VAFSQAGDDERRIMRLNDQPVRGSAMPGSRVRSVGGLQRGQGALVVCVVAVLAMASAASAQCLYEVTYIEPPECPLGTSAGGFGLNDRGAVVGRYLECWDATDEAFVWVPELGFVTLPRPNDSDSGFACDINNAGDIVGYVDRDFSPARVAALWRNFELIELGTLPGDNFSEAHAINDAGQIVGYSLNTSTGPLRPFLWEDGVMTELEVPLGPSAVASGISENGMVTGWMGASSSGGNAPFIWRDGETETLSLPPLAISTDPFSVNRLGEVAGRTTLEDPDPPGFVRRATLWRGGEVILLAKPPEFRESYAFDVGEAGQVIGYLDDGPASNAGVMWTNGEVLRLTELLEIAEGLEITSARRINDRGQILAAGTPGRGPKLLTPIDPPVGDVNTDCTVDVLDLIELLEHWGPTTFDAADLDANGVVNVFDLLMLLANWGATAMP